MSDPLGEVDDREDDQDEDEDASDAITHDVCFLSSWAAVAAGWTAVPVAELAET
jgi:hypothetical protein